MTKEICVWIQIPYDAEVYDGQYETTCGGIEHLPDRDWEFCPFCGGELKVEEVE